ncbi:MAG TPA: CoA protein activase [Clostridiales bacterium]|nr:CoA protein activase [Clostridiales bacterium]
MVLTFPHMGQMYIPAKAFFEEMGIETIPPPPVTKRTLELGTKYSPEFVCLPFKINLGNYIESIEKGADTIVITGSCGPCRFGLYGIVQVEILRELGYDVDILVLDPPREDYSKLMENLKKIGEGKDFKTVSRAARKAAPIVISCDKLYELAVYKRARERIKGDTDKILNEFERTVYNTHGADKITELLKLYSRKLKEIPEKEEYTPIYIGLVGEIYTLIEPYVNLDIERKLGLLGVHVSRNMKVDWWVRTHLLPDIPLRIKEKIILHRGRQYLGMCIGGHARQTIAHSINYAKEGYDGIIQVMPFACMPEVVAQSILPSVSRDKDIPIMTFTVDEITGDAGYNTRLEAFVETIKQRKIKA